MENRRIGKLFLVLLFCIGYIISFSLFGEQMYERVFAKNEGFSEGTYIGPVDVSLLSHTEALQKLQIEQSGWTDQAAIELQYKEKKIAVDEKQFLFLPENSVGNAQSGKQNQLFVEFQEQAFNKALEDARISEENFDREAFRRELLSYPSMLEKGNHVIKLENFLKTKAEDVLLSEAAIVNQENSEQFELWIAQFPTVSLKPHSQFSLLEAVEEKGIKTFTSEGLSMIATTLYKAVLPTNFSIIERSISREIPSYAKAGYEAKVDEGKNMDFIIGNPTDNEYILEFKQSGQNFSVSLVGPEYLYQYKIVENGKEMFPPKNILQYDAKLPSGQQQIKAQGKAGFMMNIYRETIDESGVTINRELMGEDFYPPIHTIVVSSLQEPPEPEETEEPVETEETEELEGTENKDETEETENNKGTEEAENNKDENKDSKDSESKESEQTDKKPSESTETNEAKESTDQAVKQTTQKK